MVATRSPRNASSSPPKGGRSVSRGRIAVMIAAAVLVVLGILGFIRSRGEAPAAPAAALPSPLPVKGTTYTLKPVRNGAVTGWKLPVGFAGPRGIAVASDGRIWLAEQDKASLDVFNGTQLTRYPQNGSADAAGAFSIARGPGTSMWFTGYPAGVIGRVFPGGYMNSFNSVATTTLGIAQGPGSDMWVTDFQGGLILRITQQGKIARFPAIPPQGAAHAAPRDIVQGTDQNMWFTDSVADAVGRITTGTSPTVVEYPVGKGTQPRSIALAPDGSLWATLATRELAKVDESTGQSTIVKVPAVAENLNAVAVASDGTIWLTGEGPWVYHVDPNGSLVAKYKLPNKGSYADEIAIDSHGIVWTTASDANSLVAIDPAS